MYCSFSALLSFLQIHMTLAEWRGCDKLLVKWGGCCGLPMELPLSWPLGPTCPGRGWEWGCDIPSHCHQETHQPSQTPSLEIKAVVH